MDGFEIVVDALVDVGGALLTATGASVLCFVLAATFGWSASAKLRRPARAAAALRDFGVVSMPRPWQGATLGAAELALAASLALAPFVPPLRVAALVATIAITLAFAAAQTRSIRAGQRFACFCFGDESAELSRLSIARSVLLGALAALALAGTGGADSSVAAVVAEAAIALASVATVALVSWWRRFVGWSRDPFGLRAELWVRRA